MYLKIKKVKVGQNFEAMSDNFQVVRCR